MSSKHVGGALWRVRAYSGVADSNFAWIDRLDAEGGVPSKVGRVEDQDVFDPVSDLRGDESSVMDLDT